MVKRLAIAFVYVFKSFAVVFGVLILARLFYNLTANAGCCG